MIEGCRAIDGLRLIGAGNDGDVHYPPAALFALKRGLLNPVPKPAVVDRQVACRDIKTNFLFVRRIIDKISLLEQQAEQALRMRARQHS